MSANNLLVLYDGVCGLCDRTVQFLLGADRGGVLRYAPLQGETAADVRRRHEALAGVDSIIFVKDAGTDKERLFVKSEAVFRILAELSLRWRIVSWLRAIPRPVRDTGYDWVARNRYRWFGKFDACKMPGPDVRSRFLP